MFSALLSVILAINELMPANVGEVMSPAANFDSWIELYNPSDQAVSLAGMYLSDNAADLKRWQMPANIGVVPAKGFKVVWLGSNDIRTDQASFKLDCDGGTICLSDSKGSLLVSQTYPVAISHTAYARKTDGSGEWGWTADATPGQSNSTARFAEHRLAPPVVSHDSRLFTSTFKVKVDVPEGATLVYTTDGSLPLAPKSAAGGQGQNPEFTVSRTTNYTFRLFQDGYLPSIPVTRSYIKTSNKYTLPVISIVGDEKYFTDPKIGIDCNGDGTNGKTGNGQNVPRNYNQPWNRPVNFSYLSAEGDMLFSQDVNIKVSGGWTRTQRYRSFKLKSSKVFDGQNRFNYSFFPQKPYIRNKTLLVRNGGNDVWQHNARFMDPALETIIQRSGIDLDVQSCVPIIEYVNGVLRGVLNLREPNNDDFAYANFGYDDEELDAFENMTMKNGTDEVLNRIFELGRHINDAGAYDELRTLLDIDEFTNYMAVTMFLDNDDWPNNNIKAYRSQHDGRYRFVSFDLDYAFALRGFNRHNDDPFAYFLDFKDASRVGGENNVNREIVRLFLNLLGHAGYRRLFTDTFCLVAGSVFEPTRAGGIIDELLAAVKPMTQLMKQQGIYDGHDPDRTVNTIKNKLKGRSDKLTRCMQNFQLLNLGNTSRQSVILKTDNDGARIFVNGIPVPYSDFKGYLFSPVTLRAEPPAGYRFAGWKNGNAIVSTDAEMTLSAGSAVLTATFVPLTETELAAQGVTPVRINEVSAANGIYVNEYFKRNDWIELYNTTDDPIDVEGMYLTDNPQKPKKYQISKESAQANTVIPAHGFLIVWCDKLATSQQLHASFKLGAEGGEVQLMAADESWTDRFVYYQLKEDQTAGRYPDGGAEVYTMNIPTIDKTNVMSSYALAVEQLTGISGIVADATLSLSYAVGRLAISGTDGNVQVSIVNLAGQSVARTTVLLSGGTASVPVYSLQPGVYIATATDDYGNKSTRKFIKR